MFNRIKKFFDESRTEFRHVNWPTRDEEILLTSVVIGLSLILAAFLGLSDYAFTNIVKYLVFNY
jgi:preprotein translocase subunit SecE